MRTRFAIVMLTLLGLACVDRGVAPPGGAVTADDGPDEQSIVPESGFEWPGSDRDYWPTASWRAAPAEQHGLDPMKLAVASDMAQADPFFRSLLVVRDGVLVFERYYHGGGRDQATEVWSVTKSFTSALIGIAIDKGDLAGTDELMADLMPGYAGFGSITVENVPTHETGLDWDEGSQQTWIESPDWIAEGLRRGFVAEPGQQFRYSSANSHFLSALIKEITGESPGDYADEHLFTPLGIEFVTSKRGRRYTNWQQLHEPSSSTWRQDNSGLEIGAFGLRLTAREMAKFGLLYLNRGMWNGRTIVPESWVRISTRDHVQRSESVGFGYHWMVVRRAGQIGFDADGWGGQSISVIPALDMVIVTKCDAVNPQGQSSYRVLEQVLEAVLE